MSSITSIGILLLLILLVLGIARGCVAYLQSDACVRRYGREPYEDLVRLFPKRMSFYNRLTSMHLVMSGLLILAFLVWFWTRTIQTICPLT